MADREHRITDNLDLLIGVLPPQIRAVIIEQGNSENLVEVVLDLDRQLEVRYVDKAFYLDSISIPLNSDSPSAAANEDPATQTSASAKNKQRTAAILLFRLVISKLPLLVSVMSKCGM